MARTDLTKQFPGITLYSKSGPYDQTTCKLLYECDIRGSIVRLGSYILHREEQVLELKSR